MERQTKDEDLQRAAESAWKHPFDRALLQLLRFHEEAVGDAKRNRHFLLQTPRSAHVGRVTKWRHLDHQDQARR